MKIFLSLTFMLLLFAALPTFGQSKVVTGQVFSKKDNKPITGASVILKGTAVGTASDIQGRYKLRVEREEFTLIFSYIGYQPQEVSFYDDDQVDVYLIPLEGAEEAFGPVVQPQEIPKREKSEADLIDNVPFQSFDRALQGRVPGLLITSVNGIPGGLINARIRGVGSIFAGNDPLYIVDGVLINSESISGFTHANPLAFLNPNEIASIEVLRDAASTAIYGNQGANGVVLVTTKKGKIGRTRVGLNAYAGEIMPIKLFDLLDGPQWFALRRDAFRNSDATNPEARALANMGALPQNWNELSPEALEEIGLSLPSYDWQGQMIGRSMVQNYELNVSGGTETTSYYLAGSYHFSGSTFDPVDFERGTLRASISQKIGDKISLETNVNLASIGQNIPFATEGQFLGNPAFASSMILRHNPIFNDDGSFNEQIGGLSSQNVALVNEFNSGKTTSRYGIGNLVLNYQITDEIKYRGSLGADYRDQDEFRFRDPRTPDGRDVDGRNSVGTRQLRRWMNLHTINWSKKIEDNFLSVYVGYEYLSEDRDAVVSETIGISTPGLNNLIPGSTLVFSDTLWTGYRRQGAFIGSNYEFQEKYHIHIGVRFDGSSRFGANYRYGLFPFAKVAWDISKEDFLNEGSGLSQLKLRASWGRSGNDQIGDFGAFGFYGEGNTYAGQQGIRIRAFDNANLRWETNQTINFGLDFGFWQNRLSGSIDVFERRTRDLLLDFPVLLNTGTDRFLRNAGLLRNRGIELELNSLNLQRGSFSWATTIIFSFIENEVLSLYDGLQAIPENPRWAVGQPVGNPAFQGQASPGAWFLAEYAGVNPATGRPMWFDVNGNYTYLPTDEDRVYFGSNFPPYFGGFNNTFRWGGFELSTLFTYQFGAVVSDGQYGFLRDNGNRFTFNALSEVNDRAWRAPGDMTDIPRDFALSGGDAARSRIRNFGTAPLLFSDFIRLSEVKFAYVFKPSFLNSMGLQQASIYAQGVNLWTFSNYPGYDPEFMGSGTGHIPVHKSYIFGIQLGF